MALVIGDQTATTGMTKAIFDQLDAVLMSEDDKAKMKPADLEKVREGWRKLAVAIATGVVNHLKTNMEVMGIQASGTINVDVKNDAAAHIGTASGPASLTQSGLTTGHIN
jgi:hypothetical protein